MTIECQERRVAAGGNLDGSGYGSTGTIETVASSALVPGEKFFLRSLKNSETVTFEFFDPDNTKPTTTRLERYIPIVTGETGTDVANRIVAEINRVRALLMFAHRSGPTVVTVTHMLGGLKTNYSHPADEVADAGFVVNAMAGGVEEPRFVKEHGCTYFDQTQDAGLFVFSSVIPSALAERVGAHQVMRIGGGAITWRVEKVILNIPSATAYSIVARSPDNQPRTLASDSAGGYVSVDGPFDLFWDERLEVSGTGTPPADGWWVRVFARPVDPVPAEIL